MDRSRGDFGYSVGRGSRAGMRDSASSLAAVDFDLRDIRDGRNDWENIQDVLRFSFATMFETVGRQQSQIDELGAQLRDANERLQRKADAEQVNELRSSVEKRGSDVQGLASDIAELSSEVAMKADATYVNECLLTKANKSEALTTVATQSLDRRVEGLQDAVRDHQVLLKVLERSRSDADSKGAEQSTATQQLVSRLQQDVEGIRTALDRTVGRDELDSALEGKANKSSVATALHRKLNKAKLEDELKPLRDQLREVQEVTLASQRSRAAFDASEGPAVDRLGTDVAQLRSSLGDQENQLRQVTRQHEGVHKALRDAISQVRGEVSQLSTQQQDSLARVKRDVQGLFAMHVQMEEAGKVAEEASRSADSLRQRMRELESELSSASKRAEEAAASAQGLPSRAEVEDVRERTAAAQRTAEEAASTACSAQREASMAKDGVQSLEHSMAARVKTAGAGRVGGRERLGEEEIREDVRRLRRVVEEGSKEQESLGKQLSELREWSRSSSQQVQQAVAELSAAQHGAVEKAREGAAERADAAQRAAADAQEAMADMSRKVARDIQEAAAADERLSKDLRAVADETRDLRRAQRETAETATTAADGVKALQSGQRSVEEEMASLSKRMQSLATQEELARVAERAREAADDARATAAREARAAAEAAMGSTTDSSQRVASLASRLSELETELASRVRRAGEEAEAASTAATALRAALNDVQQQAQGDNAATRESLRALATQVSHLRKRAAAWKGSGAEAASSNGGSATPAGLGDMASTVATLARRQAEHQQEVGAVRKELARHAKRQQKGEGEAKEGMYLTARAVDEIRGRVERVEGTCHGLTREVRALGSRVDGEAAERARLATSLVGYRQAPAYAHPAQGSESAFAAHSYSRPQAVPEPHAYPHPPPFAGASPAPAAPARTAMSMPESPAHHRSGAAPGGEPLPTESLVGPDAKGRPHASGAPSPATDALSKWLQRRS